MVFFSGCDCGLEEVEDLWNFCRSYFNIELELIWKKSNCFPFFIGCVMLFYDTLLWSELRECWVLARSARKSEGGKSKMFFLYFLYPNTYLHHIYAHMYVRQVYLPLLPAWRLHMHSINTPRQHASRALPHRQQLNWLRVLIYSIQANIEGEQPQSAKVVDVVVGVADESL